MRGDYELPSMPPEADLTAEQVLSAQSLATFIRDGTQPPKGTVLQARTNPHGRRRSTSD